eukprot:705587-Pelagomonas_calceolata.AAC.2
MGRGQSQYPVSLLISPSEAAQTFVALANLLIHQVSSLSLKRGKSHRQRKSSLHQLRKKKGRVPLSPHSRAGIKQAPDPEAPVSRPVHVL